MLMDFSIMGERTLDVLLGVPSLLQATIMMLLLMNMVSNYQSETIQIANQSIQTVGPALYVTFIYVLKFPYRFIEATEVGAFERFAQSNKALRTSFSFQQSISDVTGKFSRGKFFYYIQAFQIEPRNCNHDMLSRTGSCFQIKVWSLCCFPCQL